MNPRSSIAFFQIRPKISLLRLNTASWGPLSGFDKKHFHASVIVHAEPARFVTLACESICMETEAKKSRFITWAWPITSTDDALAKISLQHDPSASHNCFAFKIGQQYRSSDDGEPGGTAGRPILAAIENEGIDRVAVLVIRHFGGIKLGTGGLVRAYGNAARACLREAPRHEVIPRVVISAVVPFDCLGAAYQAADQSGASRVSEDYESQANTGVVLKLEVDADKAERLCENLKNASAGKIRATVEST
ncbi:hypothetical protein Ndes2526B_g06812 [Nannochloris sp. 'desiccata']